MLTANAKQELSPKDYSFLEKLIGRGVALMTPVEKAHVVARRDYLSKETLKELNIKSLQKDAEEAEDAGEQVSPYATMSAKELKELCADRGIEGVTKKEDMIEALGADDRGELDEEEE